MILMIKYLLICLLLISVNNILAQEWKKKQELRGVWKFTIGDNEEWAHPSFDDSDWADIFVPSSWEDEGYPGYDGFAWYRKEFEIKKNQDDKNYYLQLGYIDDVDEVYVNGIKVGSNGSFPPFYNTAYNNVRLYRLPDSVLNRYEKNIIAVRVFDRELTGGIIRGNCGIYEKKYKIKMEISLEGFWQFKTGDNSNYKRVDYSDNHWEKIYVPDNWENQNITNYDGYA